jgi:HD-GYP domain-containing protein (c-di-GMP phosphodiesterase class II)
MTRSEPNDVRLAEIMMALSIATDIGMGQPIEHAMSTAVLGVRLGDALGLDTSDLRDIYYNALLRYVGCNAETRLLASIVGDEIAFRHDYATVDAGRTTQVLGMLLRYMAQANAGSSTLHLARMVAQGFLALPEWIKEGFAGHCEVAERLAQRLGFGSSLVTALGQLYERWDGRGTPAGLKGENVALSVRVVTLAQDAVTFFRLGGASAAIAVARERTGAQYDPRVVSCFLQVAKHVLADFDREPSWESVLALEPGPQIILTESELDNACRAIADFTDIKSPYLIGHSPGVAALAAEAGRRAGLPDADVTALRRAGLIHDIGRVGVSAGTWGKPGPLTSKEWEAVRLHPYYTERILARPALLARLGQLAGHHHERLDGSGYHRGATAAALSPGIRILAAADVYHATTEPRPHRPARRPAEAADELRNEARAGRLDSDAVQCVLASAGHRVRSARGELVAGLSDREVEVLRLVARGNSMKQIAASLTISEKTVDNHIQHIYTKIGVSTRAGATLFAMEHDLLGDVY